MQLVPQGFHDHTDQRICNGIRRQSFTETNRVMPACHCDRAGQTDESPGIPHSFACRWKGCDGKKSPKARNRKACTRPYSDSIFHATALYQHHSTTFPVRSVTVINSPISLA